MPNLAEPPRKVTLSWFEQKVEKNLSYFIVVYRSFYDKKYYSCLRIVKILLLLKMEFLIRSDKHFIFYRKNHDKLR